MNFYKKLLWMWMFLALLCILSGCGNYRGGETTPTGYRVVWKIEVTYRNGDQTALRSYEDQEKMQMILTYLRWIDPYGTPAEDPMAQQGQEFDVRLCYSDGTTKTYQQRCDRYMRVGEGPWKKIDPEHARELGRILGILEEKQSTTAPNTEPQPPLLQPRLKWAKKEAVLLL